MLSQLANNSTTVNVLSLPPELLCHIFLHLSQISPCKMIPRKQTSWAARVGIPEETYTCERGWFPPVMQTCRDWRMVAIDLSELWAQHICSFRSAEATETFLKRAKGSSRLTFVAAHRWSPLTDRQVLLAEENISRVRVFKQAEGRLIPTSFAETLRAATLSNLVVLRLNRWHDNEKSYFKQGYSLSVVDSFAIDAPALEELSLDSVLLVVHAPKLRALAVSNTRDCVCFSLSNPELRFILTTAPLLEQLSVGKIFRNPCVRVEDDENAVPMHIANLPRLRSLCLEQSIHSGFFKHVNGASDASVTIKGSSVSPALTTMERYMHHPAYDTLLLFEESNPTQFLRPTVHIYLCSSSFRGGKCDHRFRMQMPVNKIVTADFSWLELVQKLVPHLNIGNITFLDLGEIGVDRLRVVGMDDMRNTLALFTGVTTARLCARRPEPVKLGNQRIKTSKIHFAVLRAAGTDEITHASALPLPALQHLIVHDYRFEESWAVVSAVLRERKRIGHLIRFLTLCKGHATNGGQEDEHDAVILLRAEGAVEQVFYTGEWKLDTNEVGNSHDQIYSRSSLEGEDSE